MKKIKEVGNKVRRFAKERTKSFIGILAVVALVIASLSVAIPSYFSTPQVINLAEGIQAEINQSENGIPMQTYILSIADKANQIELNNFTVIPLENETPVCYSAVEIGNEENGTLVIEELTIRKLNSQKLNIINTEIQNLEIKNVKAEGMHYDTTIGVVNGIIPVVKETKGGRDSNRSIDKVIITPKHEQAFVKYLTLDTWNVQGAVTLKNLVIKKLILENVNVGANDGLGNPDINIEATVQNFDNFNNQLDEITIQ